MKKTIRIDSYLELTVSSKKSGDVNMYEEYNKNRIDEIFNAINESKSDRSLIKLIVMLFSFSVLCTYGTFLDLIGFLTDKEIIEKISALFITGMLSLSSYFIVSYHLLNNKKLIEEDNERYIVTIIGTNSNFSDELKKEILDIIKKNDIDLFYNALRKSNILRDELFYYNAKYFLNKTKNKNFEQSKEEKRNIFNRKKIRIMKELEKEAKSLGIENKKEVKEIERSEEKNEKKIRIRNF